MNKFDRLFDQALLTAAVLSTFVGGWVGLGGDTAEATHLLVLACLCLLWRGDK